GLGNGNPPAFLRHHFFRFLQAFLTALGRKEICVLRIGACASFGGRDIFYLPTTFSQRNGRAARNLLIQKILKLLCCFCFILLFQLFPHFFYQRFDKVPEQDKQTVCRSQPFLNRWCFQRRVDIDRKSTRLNSSHVSISYAVFC